ncbi:MAG: hypothetical protein V1921_03145 [Candidatus Altiarchaeota archaeon]
MKKLLPLLVIITAVFIAGCAKNKPEINSFDSCVSAGNPVMESYPRQCSTSDGKTFVEELKEAEKPKIVEKDEHGCMLWVGYSWCDSKQKCLKTWQEDCPLTEELCKSGGGRWNECSNRCQLDSQGKEGVACTMQCEQLCECAGTAGLGCPKGYTCKAPEGVKDALGYCTPDVELDANEDTLLAEEALRIAKDSECTREGRLTESYYYNGNTGTWWIDLDLKREGCSPACVVSEDTRTAEINWRCTGLIPETY